MKKLSNWMIVLLFAAFAASDNTPYEHAAPYALAGGFVAWFLVQIYYAGKESE